nr:C2 calcium-dependent membrane targeting [Tanacetum cinerariifolium]
MITDFGVGPSDGVNKNKADTSKRIGFGNFVEFKVDGIPSKLGLYVEDKFDAKKMEMKLAEGKTGFKKTLNATEYMFSRKLEGFFERYVDVLKYQGCRKEGSGNANISYANRAADAQANGQNNEGDNNILGDIGMEQGMVVDNIRVTSLRDEHADIDMNQEETQEEVLRSVDDVDATIERRKWFDMSDIPSFSLGVTQDFALLYEDVVTPEANTHEQNLASEISNPLPLRPILLRVCPRGTAVGRLRRDKDKRPVTISEVKKSPFIGRVVDADGSLNATEKRVTKYLFEVLEDHRMFLPTFVVNNTVYNTLLGREGRFQSFMGYVVNAIENNGKCELLKDIDVIFIPVDNGGYKFLFVADLKNSRALPIDHEKNEKIVRKRVKKKIKTCDNIKVAAMLQEDFGQYLMLKNHLKARNFIG